MVEQKKYNIMKKKYMALAICAAVMAACNGNKGKDAQMQQELAEVLASEKAEKEAAEQAEQAALAAAQEAEAAAQKAAQEAAEKAEKAAAKAEAAANRAAEETYYDGPSSYIPGRPECRVSGNIPGYGNYVLVIHDGWGEISPGVRNKEGQLSNIYYDSSTGQLSMDAYTKGGTYCGQYFGYLSVENGRHVYNAYFCNTRGKQASFVMTGR